MATAATTAKRTAVAAKLAAAAIACIAAARLWDALVGRCVQSAASQSTAQAAAASFQPAATLAA